MDVVDELVVVPIRDVRMFGARGVSGIAEGSGSYVGVVLPKTNIDGKKRL